MYLKLEKVVTHVRCFTGKTGKLRNYIYIYIAQGLYFLGGPEKQEKGGSVWKGSLSRPKLGSYIHCMVS